MPLGLLVFILIASFMTVVVIGKKLGSKAKGTHYFFSFVVSLFTTFLISVLENTIAAGRNYDVIDWSVTIYVPVAIPIFATTATFTFFGRFERDTMASTFVPVVVGTLTLLPMYFVAIILACHIGGDCL